MYLTRTFDVSICESNVKIFTSSDQLHGNETSCSSGSTCSGVVCQATRSLGLFKLRRSVQDLQNIRRTIVSSVRTLQIMRLNGAQACAGAPKRQLVFRTEFVPNQYTTAVSPGGVLQCIFVLAAVICQTGRDYDEPLNTLLHDTRVCSKWPGVKIIFQ